MEVRIYKIDAQEKAPLKKILEADSLAADSFARQGYLLKDSTAVGIGEKLVYLYIKAEKTFFDAKEKLLTGGLKTIKRLEKDEYEKVKAAIEAQESAAEAGLGAIFG